MSRKLVFIMALSVSVGLGLFENVDRWRDRLAVQNPNVIWVPDNYTTIQAAVYAANPGDTIMVRNGTYYENVEVNQTVRLIGEDMPIILGRSLGFWGYPVFRARADNVTISGFIIQHESQDEMDHGIEIGFGGNISGNVIRNNTYGIVTDYNNTIFNNIIQDNGCGIVCSGSWNTITENTFTNNGGGVLVARPLNTLVNNTILDCGSGIVLQANETILRGNNLTGSIYGFYFDGGRKLNLYIQDIDTSNTIDGKPMYYWINQHNKTVPADPGYVALVNCTNITVCGLDLERNGHGLLMAYTENSTVRNCNIRHNKFGIFMWASQNNSIYHNNFFNNTFPVGNMDSWYGIPIKIPANIWDDGYPSGGNYWSNYTGVDQKSGAYQNETGSDGVGDRVHQINAENQDNYPLMAPISVFDVGTWNDTACKVHVVSNSTVSSFQLNETKKIVSFNVTGEAGLGFCRVTIPNVIVQDMWVGNYTVLVDEEEPLMMSNWTDAICTYIYFTYQHSEHQVIIIPEFPSFIILPLFMVATLLTVKVYRKKLNS